MQTRRAFLKNAFLFISAQTIALPIFSASSCVPEEGSEVGFEIYGKDDLLICYGRAFARTPLDILTQLQNAIECIGDCELTYQTTIAPAHDNFSENTCLVEMIDNEEFTLCRLTVEGEVDDQFIPIPSGELLLESKHEMVTWYSQKYHQKQYPVLKNYIRIASENCE